MWIWIYFEVQGLNLCQYYDEDEDLHLSLLRGCRCLMYL